jgi:anti-anti-sigma factor
MGTPRAPRRLWDLQVTERMEEHALVLAPAGRIGTLTAGDLIDALLRAVGTGRRRIVIDFEAVDYISSAGLLGLDAAAARVHQGGGQLIVCSLAEPVRLALDLSGMLSHLVVEPTVAAARDRLARETAGHPSG